MIHRHSISAANPACASRVGPIHHRSALGSWAGYFMVMSVLLAVAGLSQAQDTLGTFRTNPIQYFAANGSRTWVGRGQFMMNAYSDTIVMSVDSGGRSLNVRRVLVNEDDTVVVSRGHGVATLINYDTSFALRWTEARYHEATGRMHWVGGQWLIEFGGEWGQWSIALVRQNDHAFATMVGRALGNLPPVRFTALTYQALPSKGKKSFR